MTTVNVSKKQIIQIETMKEYLIQNGNLTLLEIIELVTCNKKDLLNTIKKYADRK